MTGEPAILCEVRERAGIITLNRPEAINALTLAMLSRMQQQLREWATSPSVDVVIVRGAGPRGFCAGGDVRAVYAARGDALFMDRVYRVEYELDEYIGRYPKPYVALMAGITMGGGCGISVHGAHRVVTETTTFAMPEVAIGLFPDVGATYRLSRCPGYLGMYVALTGRRITGEDAIALGLADHCVASDDLDRLVRDIARSGDVAAALSPLRRAPSISSIVENRAAIDACFSVASVADILDALAASPEPWAAEARRAIVAASPTSIAITFRTMREATTKSLQACLATDFRIAQRLMLQADYFEGVRALLVDKDGRPRWSPATLDDVDPRAIDAFFAPLAAGYEMTFP